MQLATIKVLFWNRDEARVSHTKKKESRVGSVDLNMEFGFYLRCNGKVLQESKMTSDLI